MHGHSFKVEISFEGEVDPGAGWFPHFVGFASESGAGAGEGANLNLPLSPGSGDDDPDSFHAHTINCATVVNRPA